MDGGTLYLLLRDKARPLTDEMRMSIVSGVARGLNHLHYEGIVHRCANLQYPSNMPHLRRTQILARTLA